MKRLQGFAGMIFSGLIMAGSLAASNFIENQYFAIDSVARFLLWAPWAVCALFCVMSCAGLFLSVGLLLLGDNL